MEVAGNDLANTTRSPDQVANLYIDQAIILVKNFGVMECRKVIICAALYQAQVSGMGNKLYNNRIDEFNGYLQRALCKEPMCKYGPMEVHKFKCKQILLWYYPKDLQTRPAVISDHHVYKYEMS